MVSSRSRRRSAGETRTAIFLATRELFSQGRDFAAVSMGAIASAAGITRAGLYLHFPSKADLFVAFVGWVDEQEGLMEHFAPVMQETDPVRALDLMIELYPSFAPRIHELAIVLDAARLTDEAVSAAWNDRMASRREFFGMLVDRAGDAGALREGLTRLEAVDLIWALTSVRFYDDLIVQSRWPPERWVSTTQELIHHAILR